MIISHVKIIAFQLSLFCKNYRFSKTVLYIINRIIHGCLEIPYLFLVLNMISHSFAALTREISCSTLEINMVFPRTHVLFSIYSAVIRLFPKEITVHSGIVWRDKIYGDRRQICAERVEVSTIKYQLFRRPKMKYLLFTLNF